MCHDCAFRPGSPERQGDERYHGSDGKLDELAWSGEPFYCHQGLRRVVAWRHPADVEVPAGPDDYDPPVGLTMPYQADGTPAEVCAGWAARRRALEAEAPADAE